MRRRTLAARVGLVTTAVAAVAVLIAGLVSYGLVLGAADDEAQRVLARQADVVASTAVPESGRSGRVAIRVGSLRQQGIAVARIGRAGRALGDPLAVQAWSSSPAVRDGRSLRIRLGGESVLVETRKLESGGAVVLAQPRSQAGGLAGRVLRRTTLALLAGLAVAAVAGVVLA
ncbi:MAG: sensor histidine kinase, partial [Actinomycetota bacterium]|nr:sensor histidine kinase [Actinomycetota bacterium]